MDTEAYAKALELTRKGAEVLHGDRDEAERCYLAAVELAPDLEPAWFDLGLVYKWSHRWERAFDCNLRAAELTGEVAGGPAWWNLGTAATALRRWDVARRAWRAYGVELPVDEGEIHADFGYGAVRVNPDGDAEVLWGRRVDPARIRITSVPFPQSGHRWGDIVLHDGAPNGEREVAGRLYPVFDELERWQPSPVPTVTAAVSAEDVADYNLLIAAVDGNGYAAEDWTQNVRLLCRRCSQGTVHSEHSEAALHEGREHFIGMAGSPEHIYSLVQQWEQRRGCTCHSIDTEP